MKSGFLTYLRDRWPFSHAIQADDIERLVSLCGAESWHVYAIKSRIWRRHVCIACNWVADCTAPNERVFEPGCGSGANLLWLAQKKGFSDLWGSDLSPNAVRLCEMLANQSNVNINIFQDDGLEPTCPPHDVATILSVNWLYHLPGGSMEKFLPTYRPCLRQHGKIVCDVVDAAYNKKAGNQYHEEDMKLPPSQRRPTRYLFRYSHNDMEKIAKDNGFRVLRRTRLYTSSVPRVVYMLEMI